MSYKNILTATENQVRTITINRPDKLNALNRETIAELSDAFTEAEIDRAVKVVIITGTGDKAFVAGADIAEFNKYDAEQGEELSASGQKTLFDLIESLKKPVIAAVNGFALGGGLELAMACHIRIASDTARMGLPEVSLGVIPGYGGTQRLPQLVGKGKAFELIMTAGMIKAEEAKEFGLVNDVTKGEELMDKCLNMANKIMKNSPVAIAKAIEAVNAGFQDGVNGFEVEIKAFGSTFESQDFKEGTDAFLNKRKPEFPGK